MSAVFVSLDPGQRTGVAVWSNDQRRALVPPLTVDYWTATEGDWALRCRALGFKLHGFLSTNRNRGVSNVICELPAFFEGEKGHAAAAKGDVVKLSYLVGVYAGMCHAQGVGFTLVPVREWKGQLSKKIVAARIRKRIGDQALDDMEFHGDIWDAVGIGLYVKGHF